MNKLFAVGVGKFFRIFGVEGHGFFHDVFVLVFGDFFGFVEGFDEFFAGGFEDGLGDLEKKSQV